MHTLQHTKELAHWYVIAFGNSNDGICVNRVIFLWPRGLLSMNRLYYLPQSRLEVSLIFIAAFKHV
jgi:hypothetical protein